METTLKIIEVVISAFGVLLIIFGWIVPYRQAIKQEANRKKNEDEAQKNRWQKEMIDKQISELYGPLSQIIRSRQGTVARLCWTHFTNW